MYNLLDPEVISNPYPLYQKLRTEAPVYWHEKTPQCWVITRYADVIALGRDPRLSPVPPEDPHWKPRRHILEILKNNLVMFSDPPTHTRLRGLMEKAFLPRIPRMPERIQKVTDSLLDAVQGNGQMDIIRDLATLLPLTVQSEFVGVPVSDSMKLTQWLANSAIFVFLTGYIPTTPENDQKILQDLLALTDYFGSLIKQRRQDPKDDLVTALAHVKDQGDQLSLQEATISAMVLTMGSFLSITVALSNCLLGLLRNPDQMQKLKDNPDLIESAVEELLRYESQVQFSPRHAVQDFELHGQLIRKNQPVIVGVGSSNRDDQYFPYPDQLDITRPNNDHIAFGYGPHACIAQPLARMHIRIAINTVLRRLDKLSLATDNIVWNGAPMFRSMESLPVTFK